MLPSWMNSAYDSETLAIFQKAYDEASKILGLDANGSIEQRDALAKAIMSASASGERDADSLSKAAVAMIWNQSQAGQFARMN